MPILGHDLRKKGFEVLDDIQIINRENNLTLSRLVKVEEHYDLLIDEENDPFQDNDMMKAYMSRWDGDIFYRSLNLSIDKYVLEVGVGTGRVAENVLKIGCKNLTGLDISQKTIDRAKENLRDYDNVRLFKCDIEMFKSEQKYDLIYSVLTMMHISNKEIVLKNIVDLLKPNGYVVLAINDKEEWLDLGNRKVRLYPKEPKYYIELLERYGCDVHEPIELIDSFAFPKQQEYGQKISTIVRAKKVI